MNNMEKINPDLQTTHLVNQVDVTAAPLLRLANDEPFSLFKRSIHHSYDELLRTWLPVPTWEQNRGNELQFTGTYSGVYAAMPAQQPRIIDNPNRITESTRAKIAACQKEAKTKPGVK